MEQSKTTEQIVAELQKTDEAADLTLKNLLFIQYFLDEKNKITFGNATQSYLHAYNLDPVKNYHHANVNGSLLLQKTEGLIRAFMEKKGITLEKLLDIAYAKTVTTNSTGWWDRLMSLLGYIEREHQSHPNVTIIMPTWYAGNTERTKQSVIDAEIVK